jgi:hypothetical protein
MSKKSKILKKPVRFLKRKNATKKKTKKRKPSKRGFSTFV